MVTEIKLFESTDNSVTFLLVGFDEKRSLQKQDTREEFLARILEAAARILEAAARTKNVKINSDEHAIFTHELQSALRLPVGFSNIYCEL
jgi:hypothetical protein